MSAATLLLVLVLAGGASDPVAPAGDAPAPSPQAAPASATPSGEVAAASPIAARTSASVSQGDATMTAEVTPANGRVGDPFELRLSIARTGGVVPLDTFAGALGDTLGDFHVEPIGQPALVDGSLVARYRLTTFASGRLTIPGVLVELRGPEGARRLATGSLSVEVASVLAENDDPKEFRGIKGELDLVPPANRWPAIVAAGAVAALAVGAGLWFVARRRRAAAVPPSAEAVAIGALDLLDREGLPKSGRVHEFHVRLTDIVRSYIERRFAIRAPELTTQEFLREARGASSIEERHQSLLASLLTSADMVKFAGIRPDPELCGRSMETARRFVEESAAPPAAAAAHGPTTDQGAPTR